MAALTPGRIRHTVSFALVHPPGSAEEADCLAAAARLAEVIPGLRPSRHCEVSPKNAFVHGLSRKFADRTTYEHPEHVAFVEDRWLCEVSDFFEVDYEAR